MTLLLIVLDVPTSVVQSLFISSAVMSPVTPRLKNAFLDSSSFFVFFNFSVISTISLTCAAPSSLTSIVIPYFCCMLARVVIAFIFLSKFCGSLFNMSIKIGMLVSDAPDFINNCIIRFAFSVP